MRHQTRSTSLNDWVQLLTLILIVRQLITGR